MNTMTEAVSEVKARDQHQSWLMRHGQHWNDVRSQTFDACLDADHAQAIDLDPQARELAIFRTNASRHLSGVELVRAVDAYADDLRKRATRIPAEELDWHHMYAWEMHAEMGYYSPFHCPCCLTELPTHAEGCLLDEPTLEATRARLVALKPGDVTAEGLDLYVDYLRATAASR